MMTPEEFMTYAGPVIIAIGQAVYYYHLKDKVSASKADLEMHQSAALAAQTEEMKRNNSAIAKGITESTKAVTAAQTTDLKQTAAAAAAPTEEKLAEIHELVNGNTTQLNAKIADLEAQLAALRKKA